jgi:acetylornithine deacetylase/succinyl-diaminopimelate desuccinylase-like protein
MLLIEGEEEVGSPNLADLLDRQGDRLAADLIVFSDTMGWSADTPAVCLGVRGLIDAELEIRGALEPVHAGAASGVAPNPAVELSRIVGALHDDRHRIAVPRFYDDVDEISPAERAALAGLTGDEQEWLRRTRTRSVRGEAGRSIGERLYTRPTVEILAMTSGADVKPTTGAIPASAKASLHVSLVPDQHPDAITPLLREWVDERMPPGLDYEFTVSEQISQPPYLTPADHPALPVLVDAMAAVWQAPVAQMRNGGSGPARLLADRAGADVLFFGTGLPEDAWHSSDESVHIETLLKGAATLGLFWSRIGAALSERPS